MPFLSSGCYVESGEKAYEAESAYYLEFQIKSALYSMERIYKGFDGGFDSKYQYYHYYTDHLLFSLGQICNRFVIDEKDQGITLERKQANRNNFEFTEEKYPILSDKRGRNTIEHIDEHDQKIIEKENGVGGFNLIDSETSADLIETFRSKRKTHIYTLDLINGTLLISRKEKKIDISLDEIKKELLALYARVTYVKEFLQKVF